MRIPYIPGKYRALSYMIYLGRKPVNKPVNKLYGTFN